LKGHVEARISDGEVDRIRCPTPQCAHLMTYPEIKHVASGDAFIKFDSLLLTKTLEADPNLRYAIPFVSNALPVIIALLSM
jgi:hypothetical protein